MAFDLASIILGIGAIVFPGASIIKREDSQWTPLLSFCMCVIAIICQLVAIALSVEQDDFAAVQDTIIVRCCVAAVLAVVVTVLNGARIMKIRYKK
ncbi:MAG TPA: hypothetical protein DCR07_05320 [Lactococcus sp.]|nr:hypothetical protein [Lactococcus sp.]